MLNNIPKRKILKKNLGIYEYLKILKHYVVREKRQAIVKKMVAIHINSFT